MARVLALKPGPEPRKLGWTPLQLAAAAAAAFFAVNLVVQIASKPSELLRFAGLGTARAPLDTWNQYGELFREHATPVATADLLAAIAQVESSGDPLAQPAWTWRWSTRLFRLYAPASSAAGLMQMTDGNFAQARRLCVKAGRVQRDCALSALNSRLVAGHAIEMTSAFLQLSVEQTLARAPAPKAGLRDKQTLAAVIHLCGPEKGPALVKVKFKPEALGRCGSHPVGPYVRRVMEHRRQFARRMGMP